MDLGPRELLPPASPGCRPVAVHTAGAPPRGVVVVVDDAVDDGGHVLRQLHHQAPLRQLTVTEVDPAARADLHRRRPLPPDAGEEEPGDLLRHAVSGAAAPAAALPGELGQLVVDLAVGTPGGDGDGAGDAVTGVELALEPGL